MSNPTHYRSSISDEATRARESARVNGRFGVQIHSEPEVALGEPAALSSAAHASGDSLPEKTVPLRDKYLTADEIARRQHVLDEAERLGNERHPAMSEQEHMMLIRQQRMRNMASSIGDIAISRARQEAHERVQRGPSFLQAVKMAFGR